MKSESQTVLWDQKTADRARIRWIAREQRALNALLSRGVFTSALHPFHLSGVYSLLTFRVPRYIPENIFTDMSVRGEFFAVRQDICSFEKCDVPIGKNVKGTRELLRGYLTRYHPERPASFQDLAVSDVWKAFAGPNGDAPRLMLPGVMVSFGSGESLIPIVDYIRPEFSDAPDRSLGFVLRAVRPSRLRRTGARTLFVTG